MEKNLGSTNLPTLPATNVRPVSMPLVDRIASGVVTAVPPIMVLIGMYFGWMGNLLNWQDILILVVCYVGIGAGVTVGFHRLLTHRSFKTHRLVRAGFAALGSAAAEGPVIDWVATHRKHHQFSDVDGDPHSPHVGPRLGMVGRVPRAGPRPHRLGVQRHGGGGRAALCEGPGRRSADPVRRPHVRRVGDRRARGRIRPRCRADRLGGRWADRAPVGRRSSDLLPAPRDVQHQLRLPLLRQARLRHPGRIPERRLAGDPHMGRGLAQQPPRIPHVLPAWAAQMADRSVGWDDPGYGDDRIGVGRRASGPGRGGSARQSYSRRSATCSPVPSRSGGSSQARFPSRPFALRFWDGTSVRATEPDTPTFTLRSPKALAHALARPRRARTRPGLRRRADRRRRPRRGALDRRQLRSAAALLRGARRGSVLALVRACGLVAPPRRPATELRLRGERHTIARDRRAVRHHYDAGNEFFALFLDRSMTYSCALFSRGAKTLEEAQEAKLELVCTKLALKPGERVLDVGCGWGSFAIHAAKRHGARVLGVTLSEPQAQLGRELARAAGVEDLVEIRVADYREITDEPFDAIVQHRDGRARRRRADRPLRRQAGGAVAARWPAAQPWDREAQGLRRSRRGPVLGAVRVPRRRAAAAVENRAGAGAKRPRDQARRGLGRATTPRRCATGSTGTKPATRMRSGSPGSSAPGSGGYTCARPGWAS